MESLVGKKMLVFVVATTHLLFFLKTAKEVFSMQGVCALNYGLCACFLYYKLIKMAYLSATPVRTEQLKYCWVALNTIPLLCPNFEFRLYSLIAILFLVDKFKRWNQWIVVNIRKGLVQILEGMSPMEN